jgi:rhodanese-related sulfurtransferase
MATTAKDLVMAARANLDLVTPEQASDEGASGGALIVDIRQNEEWQHGHIDGAVRAPRGLLEFLADPASPRHLEALDPARRVIMVAIRGRELRSRAKPSKRSATATSPSSRAGWRRGRRPGCRSWSASLPGSEPRSRHRRTAMTRPTHECEPKTTVGRNASDE